MDDAGATYVPCNVHRRTPRSKRLAAIFQEIEWIRGAWVTHVIKNRSMVGRRMAETSINEIVVASPIHPPAFTATLTHLLPLPSPYSIGSPFSPSSTYVAFLESLPRYRCRVDEIGTLIKLLLGAVEQPRLAASERVPDRTLTVYRHRHRHRLHAAPFNDGY